AHAVRESDGRRAAPERFAENVSVRLALRRVNERVRVRVVVAHLREGHLAREEHAILDAHLARDALEVLEIRSDADERERGVFFFAQDVPREDADDAVLALLADEPTGAK